MHWGEMFPHKRSECSIAYHFFELDNLVMKKSLIFTITDTSIIVSDFIFNFSSILDSIVSSLSCFQRNVCFKIQNWQKISVIGSS